MKKFIFLFSFIFLSKDVQSQNLVNNWSFEDTLSCPSGMNSLADCAGWYQARNTPDFFHTCCSNQCEVPQNLIDYQQPRTGKAYAGFLPYTTNGTNIREVLGTELNYTLQVGTKYFVTFYVSRTANHAASSNTDIAIDKIGLQFSTVQYCKYPHFRTT